jgi:cytochrome c553
MIGRRARGVAALLGLALLSPAAGRAGDAEKGRAKASACAACHGPSGISTMPDAPHLAGQPEPYLAAQLRAYRGGKRTHEAMSLVAKGLTDEDIADLAAWFSSIPVRAEPRSP